MKNKKDVANQIDSLIREIENSGCSQNKRLVNAAKAMQANQKKLSDGLSALQEALDFLRVSVKYMVFDLEATRRENEYLRSLLANDQNGNLSEER